jgi:pimeloyl-ACP methyl ester carboxylesterase
MKVPAPRVVEFASQASTLRGMLFEHPGSRPRPLLLMAHGFSATISGMVADRYAAVLHAAGLEVLLFDHFGFGISDGAPRQVINRWRQLRAYRDALDFVATLPGVDDARLAVWGDSMSGASALGVASFDDRVRCVVVQVPACGSGTAPPDDAGALHAALTATYWQAELPAVRDRRGPTAVVSADQLGAPSLLTPITAFRWFIDYGGRPGTGWHNEAIVEVADAPVDFHAGLCAPRLFCPSHWTIARDDEMPGANSAVARAAFASAPEPKEMLEIDGGHFGLLYHPGELFDLVSRAQADFLVRVLTP